ncbi:unnamed protein product [Kuraishia capsulata CBS 1993]|uniref:ATP-dependent RNA helicase n=1 Tax=Kuraishia capsulata CBS 1993 TaxID=1382522 RepID=W6MM88_9ASCO|nr:uncharacterized protein KUCA_T00001968001 [Kuraishia capsulata CBS 1993]CDK25997.1 unnamed protein product [Kuraishia capsulata CBS 1993]
MFAARYDGTVPVKTTFNPKSLIRKRRHQEVEVEVGEDEDDEEREQQRSEKSSSEAEKNEDFGMEDVIEHDDIIENEQVKITAEIQAETPSENDETFSSKHASVFKRFTSSVHRRQQDGSQDDIPISDDEGVEASVLGPIPQPALPKDTKLMTSTTRTLDWLAEPQYSKVETMKPFAKLEPPIDAGIVKTLEKEFGISDAFSVQISVIETLLADQKKNILSPIPRGDLLVNAATGSGKTLAYCVPIVQALKNRRVPSIRAVILVPTRPLITQVYSTLLKLTKGIDLNIMAFKNEVSVKDEAEKLVAISGRPDIVISTPGRVVEHIQQNHMDLSQLRYLVVDEADRLLNQSFQNWCDILISEIDRASAQENISQRWRLKCTKMIFSATLTTDSGKLSHLKLFNPRLLVVNSSEGLVKELYQMPHTLEEMYFRIHASLNFYKPLVLLRFLTDFGSGDFTKAGLVFAKSNESAIRLARLLGIVAEEFGIPTKVASVNSTLSNSERQKIFKAFANGDIDILVSTDVLARGMSLDTIRLVVNYDLPLSTKEYIHRVGRTARANQAGVGLSIVVGDGEFKWFKKVVYGGAVINRNNKSVTEIAVVRNLEESEAQPRFALDLTSEDKARYEKCLLALEKEVFQR